MPNYIMILEAALGCVKCQIGRTGVIENGFYTDCSIDIVDCNIAEIFKGFVSTKSSEIAVDYNSWGASLSCFSCNNNKTPFLFV